MVGVGISFCHDEKKKEKTGKGEDYGAGASACFTNLRESCLCLSTHVTPTTRPVLWSRGITHNLLGEGEGGKGGGRKETREVKTQGNRGGEKNTYMGGIDGVSVWCSLKRDPQILIQAGRYCSCSSCS